MWRDKWIDICVDDMKGSKERLFIMTQTQSLQIFGIIIIIIIIDRFYIALFSALEQTHCARMWFCMSEQLLIARFLNIPFVILFVKLQNDTWTTVKRLKTMKN